jgi:hypothetical protein
MPACREKQREVKTNSADRAELRFSLVCKGKRSERLASEPKGSPIALLFASASGDSVARTTGTTQRIPNARIVIPKTM